MAPALVALMPLITSLASSGLGLIGNAVLSKGKDYIENSLGVKIEDMLATPEGRLQLAQLQNDREEFLIKAALDNRKIDLEQYQAEVADRNSARDMNAKIQTSENTAWFAKNGAYILDYIIVVATLVLGTLLFFKTIPADNLQIANIMFGSLLALCGTIMNFHRGSSRSSQVKDATIDTMVASAASVASTAATTATTAAAQTTAVAEHQREAP